MSRSVVVIGASGHAKVVIELLRASGRTIAYCVGTDSNIVSCLGVPVLVGDQHVLRLHAEGFEDAFVAIGSNQLRSRIADFVQQAGFTLVNAISPNATVSPSSRLGVGVAIMAGVVINADSEIADLAIINTGATVDHDCRIGRAAHIAPQCALAGNVTVGQYSFLGIGTKVIPGMTIGAKVTIGAGGVVIRNISDEVVAFGVPAMPKNF